MVSTAGSWASGVVGADAVSYEDVSMCADAVSYGDVSMLNELSSEGDCSVEVASMAVDSERVELKDADGETRSGMGSSSSAAGSSQGGQMVCCRGGVMDVETNAAATELCAGASLHLANCLAALRNAAA